MIRISIVAASLIALVSEAHADDRTFVYARDANANEVMVVEGSYALTFGTGTSGAVRAIDVRGNGAGVLQEIGAQVNVLPALTIGAFGMLGLRDQPAADATGGGFVRLTLLSPEDRNHGLSLAVMLSGLREFDGATALSLHAQSVYASGRFRIGGNVQAERRFTSAADRIDLIARIAANYAVADELRLGVEYVGQDLEDIFENEEAEGGAVQLFALSATSELLEARLHLGLASGIAVANSPTGTATGVAGRVTASYLF